MIQDWTDGKVHDVLRNINLSNPSFQCKFIYYLRNTAKAKQTKLAKTNDIATGDSPLAVCCYVGILELAEWCLKNNSNTNSVNIYGERPLYIACHNVHHDIVCCLLTHKHKADVNKRTGITKVTPLYEACERGLTSIVLRLLKEDVDVNYKCFQETALFAACTYGRIEIVKNLLIQKEGTIYINERTQSYWSNYGTPLYIACKGGHTEIVSLLLNHTADDLDVNKDTREGETPLYAACLGGYTNIVDLLLARHQTIVIDKSRTDGTSSLKVASHEGSVTVVSTLLNINDIQIDKCILIGMSPLFIASLLGHTQIVKNLLEKRLALISVKLVSDNASEHVNSFIEGKEKDWIFNSILEASPLHVGSLMGHIEIVKLLVESNSNINCFSENGSTPLFLACELGHKDIVHVLLLNGADPTLDGKDGKSPLTIARDNGHMQMVEIIKSHTIESPAIKQSKLAKQ
ncbi:unnamed protein product [Mytilus edulis]|uniref:Uncharacterized protein n=1 Tax=Mytilus edulis TaxID=6550 RepID=A0A8S3SE26_MYTED|nr:unnamed protein product [Mytilus edulis]